jgi:hypothetical protein
MTAERQSEKLKERLHQWQSYAAQSPVADSACSREGNGPPDARPEAVVVYPHTLPSCAVSDALTVQAGRREASPGRSGERYEEQLAHLEAALEKEREYAQEMAVKWGSEVLRRRSEARPRQDRSLPRVRTLSFKGSRFAKKPAVMTPQPKQAQEIVRNYLPLLVVCVSVLLAGLCSFIALNMEWSLGH